MLQPLCLRGCFFRKEPYRVTMTGGTLLERVKLELFSSVRSTIENISMPVGVAFSGGLDSSVLLDVVARVANPKDVRAIHVCHNLRPETELHTELELVRRACAERGVALSIVTVPRGAIEAFAREKKCGIEAAARRFRYRAFANIAKKYRLSAIFVAHHMDDQLETMLMRLVHGGRLSTLAGMHLSRVFLVDPKVVILRPFLKIPKSDLILYATHIGLAWSEDSTNAEALYLRNKVRKILMPVLDEHFSFWRPAFARYQAQIEELDKLVKNNARAKLLVIEREVDGRRALDLNELRRKSQVVRVEVLRQFTESLPAVRTMGFRGLWHLAAGIDKGAKRIEASGNTFAIERDLLVFLGPTRFSSSPDQRALSWLDAALLEKSYYLKVPSFGKYQCGPFRVHVAPEPMHRAGCHGNDEANATGSVEGREFAIPLKIPFVIRSMRAGDRFSGAYGGKKLESLIKRVGLPRPFRAAVPVIEDDLGIAAVLPTALGLSAEERNVFREPLLGESVQIVYIFLSMKGDQFINA